MKKAFVLVLACVFLLGAAGAALATNGYQLIGIGQMQKSMGGAVTAAPMDAMTAISNPAGMSRIGSRADFSLELFMPVRSADFTSPFLGGTSTEGGTDMYGIPSIGWTAPAFGSDSTYFGGGMFVTSGLGVDYEQITMMPGAALDMMAGAPSGTFSDVTFEGFSAIQFWKMAPTVAWNVNDALSLGVALNLDYQSVTIKQRFRNVPFWNDPTNHAAGLSQQTINFDLGRPTAQIGFGLSLGALYDVSEMVTLGFMYSSEQSMGDAEFRVGSGDVMTFNGATGLPGTYAMDLQFPQQMALGVAVKPSEKLLVSFDLKWINWSSTHDKVKFTGPAGAFMTPLGPTDSTTLNFGWDDQTIYALGVQYAATETMKFRVGYNMGKMPIDEADVFNNLVFPAIVESHIALGADFKLGERWGLGVTYMMASKEELTGAGDVDPMMQYVTPFSANSNATVSLEETSFGMQLSYLFE